MNIGFSTNRWMLEDVIQRYIMLTNSKILADLYNYQDLNCICVP